MADGSVPETRAITLWRKAPEDATLDEAKKVEAEARLAVAEARLKQAKMRQLATDLVVNQLEKYVRLANSEDFQNAVGPIDPKIVLKLAEFATKEHRLDTGQATENVAHALTPALDFSRLTQAERNQWRELAMKAGGRGEQDE